MSDSIKVGLIARIFNNLPVWAAEELGLYSERGLYVEAAVLNGVGRVTGALRDGEIDIAVGTPESVLSDVGGDRAIVIVAGNASKLNNSMIARRGISSFEELRGGTIGVSHAKEGTALLATEMLAAHGLQAGRDFHIAAIGVASDRWERIRAGTLDAGLQTPPHKYLALDEGYPNLGDIADYVPEYQFTTINVRRNWAADNRDRLERFLSCIGEATRWMYDEPQRGVELTERALETSLDYAQRDYHHFLSTRSLAQDLLLSEAGMAKVYSVMTQAETLVATDDAERTARIDLSYLPRAAR